MEDKWDGKTKILTKTPKKKWWGDLITTKLV